MLLPPEQPLHNKSTGHVLITAVCILAVMAMIAGFTIQAVSARYKTAYRTAAWHEALVVAESGVDMTIAQVAGLLPDVNISSNGITTATSPFSTSLITGLKIMPGGLNLSNGISLSVTPDPLTHGGEGATTSSSTVTIDILPLNQLLNTNLISGALGLLTSGSIPSINILRIQSTGTVYLPGSSRVSDVSKLDADLHRAVLVTDPTGHKVSQPYVSRQIEVLLKPVFPFENGVASNGFLHNTNPGTIFDSFSSASPTTSTNNLYDPAKSRQNIQVSSNSSDVVLSGTVDGNVLTNQAGILKTSQITGLVNNSYFSAIPAINVPTWAGTAVALSGSHSVAGGILLAPSQTTYSSVQGTLHVTGNILSGLGSLLGGIPIVSGITSSEADIYVTGDFNGNLIVDPGTSVHLYVQGNVTLGPNALQNLTNVAANVQIYGVSSNSGPSPTMSIDTTGNPVAAVYAPTHAVTLSGNGGFSGALTTASLTIPSGADVHFDEALALQTGPVLGYQLIGWQELNVQ